MKSFSAVPDKIELQYSRQLDTINQSINQSNFYSANIPSEARLSGTTAKSVFNSNIEETVPYNQQAMGSDGIYRGKAKSKRCVFRYLLKVTTELAERTDSGRFFQILQIVKSSSTSIGLDPRA